MPLIEFSFILTACRALVNLFDLRDISSNSSVLAGRGWTAQQAVLKKFLLRGHGFGQGVRGVVAAGASLAGV
jgi:hypothetical protein